MNDMNNGYRFLTNRALGYLLARARDERPVDDVTVHVDGDDYVTVDGRPAGSRQSVEDAAKIEADYKAGLR